MSDKKIKTASSDEICPKCGQLVNIRRERDGLHVVCSNYPECDYHHVVPSTSILSDDTETMDRERRLMEQQGHRRHARVNAREHHEREAQRSQMLDHYEHQVLQHPALNNQRFDGIDPNINPEPALNTDARREFDNERREQDKEKQLRLGNMPKFSTAPKPQGP